MFVFYCNYVNPACIAAIPNKRFSFSFFFGTLNFVAYFTTASAVQLDHDVIILCLPAHPNSVSVTIMTDMSFVYITSLQVGGVAHW